MRRRSLSSSLATAPLTLCLAAGVAGAETVYKWVDDAGVTHFSQQPPKGKKAVAIEFQRTEKPVPKPKAAGGAQVSSATDFYGLPIPAGAKILQRVERSAYPGILVYTTALGVGDVLEFYRGRYGEPTEIARVRRSEVMTYRQDGRIVAKVAVGSTKQGTQVDLRVEPPQPQP